MKLGSYASSAVAAASVAALMSPAANATFTVDFSSVITDLGTLSTAVIGVLVAFKGAQYIWRALRGA